MIYLVDIYIERASRKEKKSNKRETERAKEMGQIKNITVLKIGLIGRLILFGDSPLNITLIALIMRLGD